MKENNSFWSLNVQFCPACRPWQIPDQYGQPIDTVVRSAIAPDEAILAEARRRGSNLIVMGVAGRPGENLFSGDTAASVLEKTPTSVLFLST